MYRSLAVAMAIFVTSVGSATGETTAFVHANVVPMDTMRVLRDQAVIVEGARIASLGPSDSVVIPDGATIVDAAGAWLMPGFTDMHIHLQMRDADPRSLLLYLAEGTTTVRSAAGGDIDLEWRDAVARGEVLGPTIASAGPVMLGLVDNTSGYNQYVIGFRILTLVGPILLGFIVLFVWALFARRSQGRGPGRTVVLGTSVVLAALGAGLYVAKIPAGSRIVPYVTDLPAFISETPKQIRAEVRRQVSAGVDIVKVYDSLSVPEYLAGIEEGKRLGAYVIGHALDEATLEEIMTSGIDEIAHLDELNMFHWRGEFMSDGFSLDYDAIPATVQLLVENDVNIVSNLSLDEVLIDMIFEPEETLARQEYRVVRPEIIEFWRVDGRQNGPFAMQGPYRRDMEFDFFLVLVKAMHDAGVIVTTGTDPAKFTEGSLPSQIHREFELLVRAGLTPFEALAAGTREPARIFERMGLASDFGTITVGNRADLVLLSANPLNEVSATRARLGVMVRGKWLPQDEIDTLLDAFIASY